MVGGWPMWPQIFKEKLSERDGIEYKLINAGLSGSGMDYSAEKFFENWIKYKDSLKIVLWGGTGYFRFRQFDNGNKMHAWVEIQNFADDKSRKEKFLKYQVQGNYAKYIASSTKDKTIYLRRSKVNHEMIVSIRDLCESYNVDFLYYPLIAPFSRSHRWDLGGQEHKLTRGETMNYLYEGSPKAWESISKDRNFIGISSFGFAWDNWRHSFRNYKNHLIRHNEEYPNNDSHPNSEGQKLIADKFWKHYEKHFLNKEKTNVR